MARTVFNHISMAILLVFANIKNATTFESPLGRSGAALSTKPGVCPAADQNIVNCPVVGDQCQSDYECSNQQKCCYQKDCGLICKDPVERAEVRSCNATISSTKPGLCPNPDPNMNCIQCYDQCTSDTNCDGLQKCCRFTCGNECKGVI